jgi:hypothetical protein
MKVKDSAIEKNRRKKKEIIKECSEHWQPCMQATIRIISKWFLLQSAAVIWVFSNRFEIHRNPKARSPMVGPGPNGTDLSQTFVGRPCWVPVGPGSTIWDWCIEVLWTFIYFFDYSRTGQGPARTDQRTVLRSVLGRPGTHTHVRDPYKGYLLHI